LTTKGSACLLPDIETSLSCHEASSRCTCRASLQCVDNMNARLATGTSKRRRLHARVCYSTASG
jgi:hypothetical protein